MPAGTVVSFTRLWRRGTTLLYNVARWPPPYTAVTGWLSTLYQTV